MNELPERRNGRPKGTTAPESDAVRRVRIALGLTQPEMATELGCSFSSVQRMERLGRLPAVASTQTMLERLARKAGVEIEKQER